MSTSTAIRFEAIITLIAVTLATVAASSPFFA